MRNGLIFLLLLFVLGLHADLRVVRVMPNKINYKLNETAEISVTLANRGKTKESAVFQLFDKWDFDRENLIAKRNITLEPGAEETLRIPWNTGKNRYGHEVRAQLLRNGKQIAAKSEFFNVINEWWRVNIGISPSITAGTKYGDRICEWYGYKPHYTRFSRLFHNSWGKTPIGPFASYFTNTTPWNVAQSTFGVFYDPAYKDNETWYACGDAYTYNEFKKDTEVAKKWGVHRTMFTIYCTTNSSGFELARKHPQFFVKDAKGDFKYNEPVNPFGLSLKGKPYTSGWSFLTPDFTNRDVWKLGVDSIITGLKHLGQNGVYFDGAYRCHEGYDYEGAHLRSKHNFDKLNHELSDYIDRRLREFKPDIYFWTNAGEGGSYRNILKNPASGTLWELGNFHHNPNNAVNIWSSLKENAVSARNRIWNTKHPEDVRSNILHIGYSNYPTGLWYTGPDAAKWAQKGPRFTNFKSSSQFWCINSHVAAIMAAVCGHPYGEGAAYRPFTQIMTRYSDFFWNEDVRLMKKAFRKFNVDSLREIWWEDFVYTRKTPTHTDYYIHLLNTPDTLRHSFETIKETREAKGVELSSRMFKDLKKIHAWTIQPYGSQDVVMEPVVCKLKPEIIDGEMVFAIPNFRYYTLLVIREQNSK